MPHINRRQNRHRRHGRDMQPARQQHPDESSEHRRRKDSRRDSPAPRVLERLEFSIRPEPPQDAQQRRAKNDREEQQHNHESMRPRVRPLYSPSMGRLLMLLSILFLTGCAKRTLDITSEPSGALVYLNGDEVGRTPLRYDFTWYSDYDVILRKDGYETLKTNRKMDAPLLFIPPLDLVGELFGAKDHRHWNFTMQPAIVAATNPAGLINRGQSLKKDLRSSPYTHPPTSLPTTGPTTRPTTRPTR